MSTIPCWIGDYQKDLARLFELRRWPKSTLPRLEQQELYLLELHLAQRPCPLCLTPVGGMPDEGECPACGAGLKRMVPLVKVGIGWHWALTEKTREKLIDLWKKERGK